MKGSLTIIAFFIIGVLLSRFSLLPQWLIESDYTLYALYLLMFAVGISIGSDKKALKALLKPNLKIMALPLGTIIGTWISVSLISLVMQGMTLTDCLAIGSGFGYYSLSSIFITEFKGAEMGTIALTSNIMRELLALLLAPFLVKYFGKLAVISAGGATTMDTTLPAITKFAGKEYVVVAIFHGFVVDFSVPFLVTFFCTV